MTTTKTCFHVKHSEVDGMGIVHHSNYPLWFEKGRKDFLKHVGTYSSDISKHGVYLPLSEIECKYKSPAKHGDEIVVITKIQSMSCVRIKFEYMVFEKSKGKLLATGWTIHAWTNKRVEPINLEKEVPYVYERLKQHYKPAKIQAGKKTEK